MRTILHQIVNKESLQRVMLILQTKLNSFARKEVENYPVKVEMFQVSCLIRYYNFCTTVFVLPMHFLA